MQQFDFILAINGSFHLECFIFNILQIILLLAQIFSNILTPDLDPTCKIRIVAWMSWLGNDICLLKEDICPLKWLLYQSVWLNMDF